VKGWWRTPGQPSPEGVPRKLALAVSAAVSVLGCDTVELRGPDGRYRFARPGVCAQCGQKSVVRGEREDVFFSAMDLAPEQRHFGLRRDDDRYPWRMCRREGCWSLQIRAILAIAAFMQRLHEK
jgi:hypothetical protein